MRSSHALTRTRTRTRRAKVELDLNRTFPEHAEFKSDEGRAALRRLLLAQATRNPQVGYTQSLNFIGAFLLLNVPEDGVLLRSGAQLTREEGAFWLLCTFTELLLPEHFTAQSGASGRRFLAEAATGHPTYPPPSLGNNPPLATTGRRWPPLAAAGHHWPPLAATGRRFTPLARRCVARHGMPPRARAV